MKATTALLVIDARVNMFATPDPVYESERALSTLRALLARARNAGLLIVYVQNNGGPGDPDQPGTPGWSIHPDLASGESDVAIEK